MTVAATKTSEAKEVIFQDISKALNLTGRQFHMLTSTDEATITNASRFSHSHLISTYELNIFWDESELFASKQNHIIINHPVHIINDVGHISPSALIPFCGLATRAKGEEKTHEDDNGLLGQISMMGAKIDQFDVHVCNSFKPKIRNDQLCYEINPHVLKNETKSWKSFNQDGIFFFVDINEDRQFPSAASLNSKFSIHLDTLGKPNWCIPIICSS